MKINSIELENYRIHKKARFEFGNGINLILGRNGAGKSSILEAIGMVLFDGDSRTSDKEAVRNGEKSSYICIEMTGNDEIEYIVEKKIGNTSLHRLYPKDNKSEAVVGRESVLAKIAEISGIEKNSKKIYQNVITAYQNKIVNIFTEKPKDRETIFNEIFDTAIYREMYQGYLKVAVDKYIIEKKIVEKEVGEISVLIENSEEIEKEINEKNEIEKLKGEEYKKLKEAVSKVENEMILLENAKRSFDRLEQEIEDRKKMIIENSNGIEKSEDGIRKSEESAKIVRDSENDYRKYIEVDKEIEEQEREILLKESIKKEIEKAEKRLEEESRKKVEVSTIKTEKAEQLKEIEEVKEKTEIKLREKEENITEFSKSLKELKDRTENKINIIKKSEEYLRNYEIIEKELSEIKNRIKIKEETLCNIEDSEKELKSTENKKSELKIKLELKNEIENNIREYDIKIRELKKAEEKLSGGICPYLKESCLNISGKSNFADYFKDRIEEIEENKTEKLKQLNSYLDIEKEIEQKNGETALLLQKIENFNKTEIEIKEMGLKSEVLIEKRANILLVAGVELKLENRVNNYEELKSKVKDINMEMASELKEKEEKEKREAEFKEEIQIIKSEKKEIEEKEEKYKLEIEQLKEEEKNSIKIIGIAEQFIKEKSEKTIDLEEQKKQTIELKEKKDSVKKGYELYSSNIKTAMNLEELKKNLEELKKSRELKKVEVSKKEIEKSVILEKFKFEEIDELKIEKTRVIELRDKVMEEVTQCKVEKGKLEEKHAENRRKNEKLKESRKKLKKIEKKIEISQKFRDNINTMGKAVAAGLLSSIEKMATENFRRMTGRDEEINWINSEKESYAVYLNGKDRGSTRFEVLSGGEQVAAALSIRAAMATTLTTANFAIFDEPTINLDKIRKEALAESLKEILKRWQKE